MKTVVGLGSNKTIILLVRSAAVTGKMASELTFEEQKQQVLPLKNILEYYGCSLSLNNGEIAVSNSESSKRIVIYPAMWVEPEEEDTIYISDYFAKYAKPYALKKILDQLSI